MIWAIAGAVTAYFAIGYGLARWDLPRLWKAARKSWWSADSVRETVKVGTVMTLLFWPVRIPALLIWDLLNGAVDSGDPKLKDENELRAVAEISE